jgi:hypothetical protein
MVLRVTKQMIADEICYRCCMIAEANQDRSIPLDHLGVFIKNFDGATPLMITYADVLKGYHAFDGYKATRIPEFISKDWSKALKIYEKLKNL